MSDVSRDDLGVNVFNLPPGLILHLFYRDTYSIFHLDSTAVQTRLFFFFSFFKVMFRFVFSDTIDNYFATRVHMEKIHVMDTFSATSEVLPLTFFEIPINYKSNRSKRSSL